MYIQNTVTGSTVWHDKSEAYVLGANEIDIGDSYVQAPPTAAQTHDALIGSAKTALDSTDMAALRCLKAGVAYPAAWQTYTTALRAIVNGSDTTSTTLPTQPAYPAGT